MGEYSRVEFEVRRWRSDLSSELRLSGGGIPGTTLDPTEALGLENERIWDYRFGVRVVRRVKLRGSWMKVKYEGGTTPSSEVCFAGLCAAPGTTTAAALEVVETRGGAEVDLLHGVYGFVAVVGEYGRYEARPTFDAGASSVSPESLRIDLPLFGVKARAYLTPALALTVEGIGMKKESEGVWTDFNAAASYSAIPNIALTYGYRNSYARFKGIEPAGDRAVMRIRGQYFGVTVRF
ncbi:MAG: hypothetical protein ACRD21_06705 [Vicinamibacteria bacterium]